MSNEKQETIADIVKRVRRDCNSYPLPTAAAEMLKLVREMDAAHQRDVAELKSKMNDVVCENEAMRDACGTCGAKRYVAELRECLKEAIREKCPFTRMSCKHGEPCDYECGTVKWRNALRNEGGAK